MTKVADLLLHPIGKKWAGSQPSFSPSRRGSDSPLMVERDDGRQHCRLTICNELVELTNSVSDDKIQITILILRRGALSRQDA